MSSADKPEQYPDDQNVGNHEDIADPSLEGADTADDPAPLTAGPKESIYSIEGGGSLLDDSGAPDRCINCGASMPNKDAVVCLHCGYDQVRNTILKTKLGADEIEPNSESAGPHDFVRPGRLGWKAAAILGAVFTVVASVLSGMHAAHHPILHGLATFLYAPVFAGLGVAAVMLAAILLEDRFGKLEYAAGRMLLAIGLVELAWHAAGNLDIANALRGLLGVGVGAGLYFLVVWWTFALTRQAAMLVSLLHLVLWAIFTGLVQLNAWLAAAPGAA